MSIGFTEDLVGIPDELGAVEDRLPKGCQAHQFTRAAAVPEVERFGNTLIEMPMVGVVGSQRDDPGSLSVGKEAAEIAEFWIPDVSIIQCVNCSALLIRLVE